MSEIKSFSDYTSKYNSNVDFSALFIHPGTGGRRQDAAHL